ncbi:hypothetical protein EKL30_01500 [Candidimonas sp. SYP-B2681]|uniref:hypothetical protein n=1 Tax=Candidimonas sp. SYP-B2681 TaxID=2497686 RepID=UPI000F8751FE|nr:hypothetical protein [Candidimonas sp. SYP-B2681]RTZ47696.1 hypothetical protein EKL30_01500 [Candidimonas sp. SYP-B2681]
MANRLFAFLLACAAVLFQTIALLAFVGDGGPEIERVMEFFAWQIFAALSAAIWLLRLYAVGDRHASAWIFLHAFLVFMFLPVVGQLLLFGNLILVMTFPARDEPRETAFLQTPRYPSHPIPEGTFGTIARLRTQLSDTGVSEDERLAAMVAMRSLPLHLTGEILRRRLSDSSEEIRLLAYGIAEAAEKSLMQRIFTFKERLNQENNAVEQAELTSWLAELHWELVYQKLVHGPVLRYTVETAERYARESLAIDEDNMDMWCLLGRCALVRDEPHAAGHFFEQARARHFPEGRLLPWMAEAAFERRDYRRIAEFLSPLNEGPARPGVQPAMNYWK